MSAKIKGLIITTIISLVIIFIFFGKIIKDPNNYYFSGDGDGFKAYYGALYHMKYDTSAMRMNGMNYPYGEMVFFTGSQPGIVNTVKFINNHFFECGDNIVGIMNLLMIFSIAIAAVFLFLIFAEFNANSIYSAFSAIGICLLSPQIARFGGHFSLSYLFWIPLMIYLIIKFDKKPKWSISAIAGLVTFLASAMHLYFAGFFGFIIGLYWFYRLLARKKTKTRLIYAAVHLLIQYVIPVVAIQTLIGLNDTVTDRTNYPFGFFVYMGHPIGVFFPNVKPYLFVPEILKVFKYISWEEIAFVGWSATIGVLIGIFVFFVRLFSGKKFYEVTRFPVLNVLFWSSFAALLFSFGIPFILGLEDLADKIGPIKQLRALARFSWFFYYMVNIVVFINLYHNIQYKNRKNLWRALAGFALLWLLFDGVMNVNTNSKLIQNRKPLLADVKNQVPENKWVNEINASDFQAILPLPFFHVGSENIWIESKHGIQELTMLASLKTGLPTFGVQLSRTSISQTYKSTSLVTEPLEPYQILNDLPSEKPILILFNRKHYPDENEIRLLSNAELIFQDENLEFRKLQISTLKNLTTWHRQNVRVEYENDAVFSMNEFKTNDSTTVYLYKNYDSVKSDVSLAGKGALIYAGENWVTLVDDTLKNSTAGMKFSAGFWMHNYNQDAFLRANLEIIQKEEKSDKTTNYIYTDVHRHIRAFYNNWALIEIDFETFSVNERIKISVRNAVLKDTEFVIDELLVRKKSGDLFRKENDSLYKNGRVFQLTP